MRFARARELIGRVVLIDLSHDALSRALMPFPLPLRTLDALHLATMEYLRHSGATVELASYDNRLLSAAQALGIPIAEV